MSRFRLLVFLLALLLALSTSAQKNSKTPKEDTYSVSGIVIKMADSAPLTLQDGDHHTVKATAIQTKAPDSSKP
jgi:hypothetical protein